MSHAVKLEKKVQQSATGRVFYFFSICMSIKTQWLFRRILLTQLPAYLTGWHTHKHVHTLLLPVWVLVVDVESLGGAQQLWKRTEREGGGGNGKKTISIGWHIVLFISVLCRNPSMPVCVFTAFLSPLHFSPSSLLPSNNLTTPTGWGAFLTSCCLTLPSLGASDTLMPTKWFINKRFCLRNVLFHLIYAAILSQLLGIESDNHKIQACQDKTNMYFILHSSQNSQLARLDKFFLFFPLTLKQTDCYLSHVLLIHSVLQERTYYTPTHLISFTGPAFACVAPRITMKMRWTLQFNNFYEFKNTSTLFTMAQMEYQFPTGLQTGPNSYTMEISFSRDG